MEKLDQPKQRKAISGKAETAKNRNVSGQQEIESEGEDRE